MAGLAWPAWAKCRATRFCPAGLLQKITQVAELWPAGGNWAPRNSRLAHCFCNLWAVVFCFCHQCHLGPNAGHIFSSLSCRAVQPHVSRLCMRAAYTGCSLGRFHIPVIVVICDASTGCGNLQTQSPTVHPHRAALLILRSFYASRFKDLKDSGYFGRCEALFLA